MDNKFNQLPDEVFLYIFKHLEMHQLLSIRRVSQRFNRIVHDDRFWRKVSFLAYDSDALNKVAASCHEYIGSCCSPNSCSSLFGSKSMEIYSPLSTSDLGQQGASPTKSDPINESISSGSPVTLISILSPPHTTWKPPLRETPSISSPIFYESFFRNFGSSITTLDLKRCIHVDTSTMLAIGNNCKSLTVLNISKCKNISFTAIKTLISAKLPNLHSISCREIKARVSGTTVLSDSPNPFIKLIDFGKSPSVNDHIILQIPILLPNIESLGLFSCDMVSNAGIEKIVTKCRNLERLEISDCHQVTDELWQTLAQSVNSTDSPKSLMKIGFSAPIDMSGLEEFPTQSLQKFLEARGADLEFLDISCRDTIDNDAMSDMISNGIIPYCKNLKYLDVSYNGSLTSTDVRSLLSNYPYLQGLRIAGHSLLTDDTFHDFGLRLGQNLRKLDISNSRCTFKSLLEILVRIKTLEHVIAKDCDFTATNITIFPGDLVGTFQENCLERDSQVKYLEIGNNKPLNHEQVLALLECTSSTTLTLLSIDVKDLAQSVPCLTFKYKSLQRLDLAIHQEAVEENQVRLAMAGISQLGLLQHLKFQYLNSDTQDNEAEVDLGVLATEHRIDDCVKQKFDNYLYFPMDFESDPIVWNQEGRSIMNNPNNLSNRNDPTNLNDPNDPSNPSNTTLSPTKRHDQPLLSFRSSNPNVSQFKPLTRTFPNLTSLEFIGNMNLAQLNGLFSFTFPVLRLIQADVETLEQTTDFGTIIERCPSLTNFICSGSHSSDFQPIYERLRVKYPHIR